MASTGPRVRHATSISPVSMVRVMVVGSAKYLTMTFGIRGASPKYSDWLLLPFVHRIVSPCDKHQYHQRPPGTEQSHPHKGGRVSDDEGLWHNAGRNQRYLLRLITADRQVLQRSRHKAGLNLIPGSVGIQADSRINIVWP